MKQAANISIRGRLIYGVMAVTLLLVFIFSTLAYRNVTSKIEELFDLELAREAGLILAIAQTELMVDDSNTIAPFQLYLEQNLLNHDVSQFQYIAGHSEDVELVFIVANEQDEVLLHSNEIIPGLIEVDEPGFYEVMHDGEPWRVYRLNNDTGTLYGVTAERLAVRNSLIDVYVSDLTLLFSVLLASLALMLWVGIDNCLQPLDRLIGQIRNRSANNLDSVDEEYVPLEVVDVVRSLNHLLLRLSDALDRERHTTSDAAHELRTPLAAIKLHAELAMTTDDPAEKNQSINQIVHGVNRATRLVEQLLALARLDVETYQQQLVMQDLCAIVKQTCEDLEPRAAAKNIAMMGACDEKCLLNGEATALKLLARNLIENAILYTQESGTVRVSVRCTNEQVYLAVEDDGPGLSDEEMLRIFDRYYRGENKQQPGSGIGLAIVSRVCEMHNATIETRKPDSGKGLLIEIAFPAASKNPGAESSKTGI